MVLNNRVRTTFLTGIAVVVPVAVSGYVLLALIRTVSNILDPVATFTQNQAGIDSELAIIGIQIGGVIMVVVGIFVIGGIAQREFGRKVVDKLNTSIENLPGIGTVYQTARQMSDLVIGGEDDTNQFRDVKLVEFPAANTYTLGFLTNDQPPSEVIATARQLETVENPDTEYRTLFLPMAPNPVMGGNLVHVPANHVYNVDLSIESAIQYILTTGIVTDQEPD